MVAPEVLAKPEVQQAIARAKQRQADKLAERVSHASHNEIVPEQHGNVRVWKMVYPYGSVKQAPHEMVDGWCRVCGEHEAWLVKQGWVAE